MVINLNEISTYNYFYQPLVAVLPDCTLVHLTPFSYPTVRGPRLDGNDRRTAGKNVGFSVPKVSFDPIDETQVHPRASINHFLSITNDGSS